MIFLEESESILEDGNGSISQREVKLYSYLICLFSLI